MTISYTTQQQAIINHTQGNALVIAGAGCGKTTTLMGLVEHRVQHQSADSILVLMFNNSIYQDFEKAAKSRNIEGVHIATFHRLARYILTESQVARAKGFRCEYSSVDRNLARNALKQIATNPALVNRAMQITRKESVEHLLQFYGLCKASLLTPKQGYHRFNLSSRDRYLADACELIEQQRIKSCIWYFDDWLIEAIQVLQQDDNLRSKLQKRFKLVLVDEYQDVNTAQFELIKALKAEDASIIAVGDVDQCIYTWRGAQPDYMLDFERQFAPATRYLMTTTFRYGHQLSLIAGHLIHHNKERFASLTVSHPDNYATSVSVASSQKVAKTSIRQVKSWLDQGYPANDICILIRNWAKALRIELGLLLSGIPYSVPAKNSLGQTDEVTMFISLLTLACDQWELLTSQHKAKHLETLLLSPIAIGKRSLVKVLSRNLANQTVDLWVKNLPKVPGVNALPNKVRNGLKQRLRYLRAIRHSDINNPGRRLAPYVRSEHFNRSVEFTANNDREKLDAMDKNAGLLTFLNSLSLSVTSGLERLLTLKQLSDSNAGIHEQNDRVGLKTIHAAKGQEFRCLLLPYWEDGSFPLNASREASSFIDGQEEERRLAYVALTRAKENLYVVYEEGKASRFINELNYQEAEVISRQLTQRLSIAKVNTSVTARYLKETGVSLSPSRTPTKTPKYSANTVAEPSSRIVYLDAPTELPTPIVARQTDKKPKPFEYTHELNSGKKLVLQKVLDDRVSVLFDDGVTAVYCLDDISSLIKPI